MLAEVRVALAAALSARLDGVAQCSAYVLANPTFPTIWVIPASTDYDKAMAVMGASRSGTDMWVFTIQALFGEFGDVGAQMKLDHLIEPSGVLSVKEAIEADGTLGGLVDDASVTTMTGVNRYQIEGVTGPVLGAEWTVQVLAG